MVAWISRQIQLGRKMKNCLTHCPTFTILLLSERSQGKNSSPMILSDTSNIPWPKTLSSSIQCVQVCIMQKEESLNNYVNLTWSPCSPLSPSSSSIRLASMSIIFASDGRRERGRARANGTLSLSVSYLFPRASVLEGVCSIPNNVT